MLLSLIHVVSLLTTLASLTTAALTTHHKVRHKHNLLKVRDNHVNFIREAFDQYRSVVHKSKGRLDAHPDLNDVYDEAIENSLRNKISQETLTKIAGDDSNSRNIRQLVTKSSRQELFSREKRVHITKATTRAPLDNYDDEYDDDSDTNRPHNDDAQAGTLRFNRDNSDTQVHQAEGETLTDYKMKTLGTPEDVKKSFQQHRRKDADFRVRENINRLRIDGMCRWPNKRVIEVRQLASKVFTPHKYVLHQCSDDTACCQSMDKTCVAKKSEEVVLWFHVRVFGAEATPVSMSVQNHTECECVYKNQVRTATAARTTRATYSWSMPVAEKSKEPACKCPTHFESEVEDGTCGPCVCKEGNVACRMRSEGREGFMISDRSCILRKECAYPKCLYGDYANGRCPEK